MQLSCKCWYLYKKARIFSLISDELESCFKAIKEGKLFGGKKKIFYVQRRNSTDVCARFRPLIGVS